MIDSSTHVASTPGIMLLRVGQAGSALRWDPAGRCWRWPDPQGGQLYAWPAPAGMPSGLRLQENACVMACCTSGRVLLGQGKRLGMVDLPLPGQASRPLQSQVLLTVDAAEPRTSISDGCTDRGGNFVFGTANTASDQRASAVFTSIRNSTACAGWRCRSWSRPAASPSAPTAAGCTSPTRPKAPSCNASMIPNVPRYPT